MEYQHPIYGPRWTEQKLTSDTKPKVRYEYWATGRREFPFDMLRHDCAWPASGDDAAKLVSIDGSATSTRLKNGARKGGSHAPFVSGPTRRRKWTAGEVLVGQSANLILSSDPPQEPLHPERLPGAP